MLGRLAGAGRRVADALDRQLCKLIACRADRIEHEAVLVHLHELARLAAINMTREDFYGE